MIAFLTRKRFSWLELALVLVAGYVLRRYTPLFHWMPS